jgi:hypothetical protein
MTITLHGYLHREPIFVIPQTTITCQECRLEETIQGDESIELEYDNAVDMEAVEESLEITMEKLGWVDMVCPNCTSFRTKHSR